MGRKLQNFDAQFQISDRTDIRFSKFLQSLHFRRIFFFMKTSFRRFSDKQKFRGIAPPHFVHFPCDNQLTSLISESGII